MRAVTVKVDEQLKKMSTLDINWSEYIRDVIQRRVELEERRRVAEEILKGLRAKKHIASKEFMNKAIRDMREDY